MKVGTDGVLLGAWAGTEGVRTALDVGTGSGLIAVMLAQRTEATIHGVEMDEFACSQAMENAILSPWRSRITIYHADFKNFANSAAYTYDLIISNPPFHWEAIKPEHTARRMARHNDTLDYSDVIRLSVSLLSNPGRLALILPAGEEKGAIELAAQCSYYTARITRVCSTTGKAPSRVLLEFSNLPAECIETELTIESGTRNQYTERYKKLTGEFYLHF